MTPDDSHQDPPARPCWLLDDGRAGHWQQVRALAAALERHLLAAGRQPPACQRLAQGGVLPAPLRPAEAPWLIGCGSRSARQSLAQGPGYRRLQILTPPTGSGAFDWVLAPVHDDTRGANVVRFHGALAAPLPAPGDPAGMASLLLGGPSSACRWRQADLRGWLEQLHELGQTMDLPACVVTSRRTPAWAVALVGSSGLRHLSAEQGHEAYRQLLARSQRLLVSADSVSMLAEACAGSAPVCVMGQARLRGKTWHYVDWLEQQGRIADVADLADAGAQKPVIEVDRVVAELARRGAFLGW